MPVTGLEKARAKMRALPVQIQTAVTEEMESMATEWVGLMVRIAPHDDGALASSIGWTWGSAPEGSLAIGRVSGPGVAAITIYAGNESTIVKNSHGGRFQNAKLQEFGTANMKAQPYFWPIIRAGKRRATTRINNAARRAAKQIWGN